MWTSTYVAASASKIRRKAWWSIAERGLADPAQRCPDLFELVSASKDPGWSQSSLRQKGAPETKPHAATFIGDLSKYFFGRRRSTAFLGGGLSYVEDGSISHYSIHLWLTGRHHTEWRAADSNLAPHADWRALNSICEPEDCGKRSTFTWRKRQSGIVTADTVLWPPQSPWCF